MDTNGSTTHTVQFAEPPNRAFRFLIGLAVLYAVWRCRSIIADFLTIRLFSAVGVDPFEGVGSVTGTVLPLLVEFVIGLGGVAVFVGSLGWSVVADLFAGTIQSIAAWRNRVTATNAARVAAGGSATGAATTAAAVGSVAASTVAANGAAVRVGSVQITDPQLVEFARLVQNTLRDQRAQIKTLALGVANLVEQTANPPGPRARKPRATRRASSTRRRKSTDTGAAS